MDMIKKLEQIKKEVTEKSKKNRQDMKYRMEEERQAELRRGK